MSVKVLSRPGHCRDELDINKLELGAIYLALLHADPTRSALILTDSASALNMSRAGRCKARYAALAHAVQRLAATRLQLYGCETRDAKVKGHSGCHGNDMADKLARAAAASSDVLVNLPGAHQAGDLLCSVALRMQEAA